MLKKTTIGGLVCGLFVGACWYYQTVQRDIAGPSAGFVSSEGTAAGQTRPIETPPAREAHAVGGFSSGSDETLEEQVQRTGFAEAAALSHLVRRLEAAARSGEPGARDQFQALLAKLTQRSPEAAAQFAQSLGAGEVRERALRRVAQLWTAQEPGGAENWARQLEDQAERASVLTDLCLQLAQTNAAQAVAKVKDYQLDAAPGTILVDLVQQWAEQDLRGAANWIEAQPQGEERERMLSRLAIVESATDPAEAVRLITDQIPAGPIQTEATISVLHQWAVRDLVAARAWVALFPAGAIRERAEDELSGIAAYQGQAD